MNVLSLFDGMSCGRIALEQIGFPITNYFASEIDSHAIKVAKANFPDTQHIGDITQIKSDELPKIDLMIGGSPCQGFSLMGKQLNFSDPRSSLFFQFVRLKEELSPTVWMLENVRMQKTVMQEIDRVLGVKNVYIDSKLVSAQMRRRHYWTNLHCVCPEDRNIKVSSILQEAGPKATPGFHRWFAKHGQRTIKKSLLRVLNDHEKSICLMTRSPQDYKGNIVRISGGVYRFITPVEAERLQTVPDNYTNHVSTSQRYKMLGNGWTVEVIKHILKDAEEVINLLS